MEKFFGLVYQNSSEKINSLLTNDEVSSFCAREEYYLPDGSIDVPLTGAFILSKLQMRHGFTIHLLSGGKISVTPLKESEIKSFLLHGDGIPKDSYSSNTTSTTLSKISKEESSMKIQIGGDLGLYDVFDTELNKESLFLDNQSSILLQSIQDKPLQELKNMEDASIDSEPLPFAIEEDEYVSLV